MGASPGPWHLHDFGTRRVVTDATGRILAELVDAPTEDVSKVNGPLIALAPDMASMIHELEWSNSMTCPVCGAVKHTDPHTPDCRLSSLLSELPK